MTSTLRSARWTTSASFANEGNGVLLITHDIELALRVADRVAVFKDGTVVEETAVANFADPIASGTPVHPQLVACAART